MERQETARERWRGGVGVLLSVLTTCKVYLRDRSAKERILGRSILLSHSVIAYRQWENKS